MKPSFDKRTLFTPMVVLCPGSTLPLLLAVSCIVFPCFQRVHGCDDAPIATVAAASPALFPPEQDFFKLSPDELIRLLRKEHRNRSTFKASATAQMLGSTTRADMLAAALEFRTESIYGPDDRTDLFPLVLSKDMIEVLRTASGVVSLIKRSSLTDLGEGTSSLSFSPLRNTFGLCVGEAFADQPSASFCTGALIASNLVLTAGHCCGPKHPIEQTRFVFGYEMLDSNSFRGQFPNTDIYRARSIIRRVEDSTVDYAIIRLDRPVPNRVPLQIARFNWKSSDAALRKISTGTPVFVIGHPLGLPSKYAGNAAVRSNDDKTYFTADLDTYGGNSGSPVFASRNGRHEIVGLLFRGLQDFDFVPVDKCKKSLRYREGEAGERCVRSSEFAHLIR